MQAWHLQLLGLATLTLSACGGGAVPPGEPSMHEDAEADASSMTQPPDSTPIGFANIRFIGRVDESVQGEVRYAWSGSGLQLRFRGTGLVLRLADHENEHTLVLDGVLQPKLVTDRAQQEYLVAEGLEAGEHTVELYRRTEASFGPTQFLGLEVKGGLLLSPPPAPERRIEVVGDSISCGYGNEGVDSSCSFSAGTQNHYLAYATVAARELGAELHTIAWSGRGVVKNYDGEAGDTVPSLYQRTLPEAEAVWQTNKPADAVVINLGTNDFSTEPDPPEATFVAAYVSLLEAIRARHPEAYILATIGPLLEEADRNKAWAAIHLALTERKAAGDLRLGAYQFVVKNEAPGCDWHPSVATHAKMAAELSSVLRTKLGWGN